MDEVSGLEIIEDSKGRSRCRRSTVRNFYGEFVWERETEVQTGSEEVEWDRTCASLKQFYYWKVCDRIKEMKGGNE